MRGYQAPAADGSAVEVIVNPTSDRLQLLASFKPWEGTDLNGFKIIDKKQRKMYHRPHFNGGIAMVCVIEAIWIISNNMLIGAVNAFNDKTDNVLNEVSGTYGPVRQLRAYKAAGLGSIVLGMKITVKVLQRARCHGPRHLGVRAVVVKSFARIHETNLKKQGMLALTFIDKNDYEKYKKTILLILQV